MSPVIRIPITGVRNDLAEIANRARYEKVVTILTRHGKDVAAVAPIEALKTPPEPLGKKRATSAKRPPVAKVLSTPG